MKPVFNESARKTWLVNENVTAYFFDESKLLESYTGTVVANETKDPENYPHSLWQCLTIRWSSNDVGLYSDDFDIYSPWEMDKLITDEEFENQTSTSGLNNKSGGLESHVENEVSLPESFKTMVLSQSR